MVILEVKNLKKIYTTRFGGNQVEALRNVISALRKENTRRLWVSPVPVKRLF